MSSSQFHKKHQCSSETTFTTGSYVAYIKYSGSSNLQVGSNLSVVSEAYHDWSVEAADAQLRVNFTLKLLLSQNFCNWPLMRFISFASNIGPAAAVPAGPAPVPLLIQTHIRTGGCSITEML